MKSFGVIVIGGGPSGICAAIAAARQGIRTALLEKHPVLGGMGTAALVNNFCNAHYDGSRFIIGGIFAEIRDELIHRKALFTSGGLEPYNHTVFIEVVEMLCREAGVETFMGHDIGDVAFPSRHAVVVEWNGERLHGNVLVDASGDAMIAHRAGVAFLPRAKGREFPMPLTYCYLFGPVDIAKLKDAMPDTVLRDRSSGQEYLYLGPQAALKECVKRARLVGDLTIPRDRIAVAYSVPGSPDILSVNFGRVVVKDPTDPEEMAEAVKTGLAQVKEGAAFFKKYVPGCEHGEVRELARQIGVRESRQIEGAYCLTLDDVLSCRQFDDVIAQCCYSVDIHEPNSDKTTLIGLPRGSHYDIPLRCLLPSQGPRNLLVAGRSISASQEAMSSFRVSPSVMAIGEAAGVTAALAAQSGMDVALVPCAKIHMELVSKGAILS